MATVGFPSTPSTESSVVDSDDDITPSALNTLSPPPPMVGNEIISAKRIIRLPQWMASTNNESQRIGDDIYIWIGHTPVKIRYGIHAGNQTSLFVLNRNYTRSIDPLSKHQLSIIAKIGPLVRRINGTPLFNCTHPANGMNGWDQFGNSRIFQQYGLHLSVEIMVCERSFLIVDKKKYQEQDEEVLRDASIVYTKKACILIH